MSFGDRGDRGFLYASSGSGTTLGVYRPENSTFLLANPGPTSIAPVTSVAFGTPGDQGLVGAWGWNNADGSDRVGVFRPATGQWFLADTPTRLVGHESAADRRRHVVRVRRPGRHGAGLRPGLARAGHSAGAQRPFCVGRSIPASAAMRYSPGPARGTKEPSGSS